MLADNSLTPAGCPTSQSYSDTTWSQRDFPGLKTQSHKTVLTMDASQTVLTVDASLSPQATHTFFQPSYKCEGSYDLPLNFGNF